LQISEIAKKKTPLIRSLCRAKQGLDYAAIASYLIEQVSGQAVAPQLPSQPCSKQKIRNYRIVEIKGALPSFIHSKKHPTKEVLGSASI